MKNWISLWSIVLVFLSLNAQVNIPAGTWRYHPSYQNTHYVESFNGQVYGASTFGMFSVNPSNNELKRYLKSEGFYTGTVSVLKASNDHLLIGYTDGFIQVLDKFGKVHSISGLFDKTVAADKRVKHVKFDGNSCYLSTEIGILRLDLRFYEIADNFQNIGIAGAIQPVNAIEVKSDTIFAATATGVIYGILNNTINLSDFNNWKTFFNASKVNKLVIFNGNFYYDSDSTIYAYNNGSPSALSALRKGTERLDVFNNKLIVIRSNESFSLDVSGAKVDLFLNLVTDATYDGNDGLWYANGFVGGILLRTGTGEVSYLPNGPSSADNFYMSKEGPLVFCTAGGVTNTFGGAFNVEGFYISDDGYWTNNPTNQFTDSLYDYTFAYYIPKLSKYFILSQSFGLVEFTEKTATARWTSANSSLDVFPTTNFSRTSGLTYDEKGIIWVSNFGSQTPLHAYNGSTWQGISAPNNKVKNIVTDKNNIKWIQLHNEGLLIFDDNETPFDESDDKFKEVKSTGSSGLLSNELKSIAIDDNGWIWLGTSIGLNVVTNTNDPFNNLEIERLIINDIDGVPAYLLGENSINDICIDGGNRKWFATNDGVVLVESDGQNQVLKFTAKNSPLPSNRVLSIGQSTKSGEVYFATDRGIASYQSDAAGKKVSFDKIKVYPNPIPPGYSGQITIDGLATNAEIRITDANGMLVTKLTANGSKAVWNGLRLNGTKPNSGVYYVFGINTEATETAMGKFIFIR